MIYRNRPHWLRTGIAALLVSTLILALGDDTAAQPEGNTAAQPEGNTAAAKPEEPAKKQEENASIKNAQAGADQVALTTVAPILQKYCVSCHGGKKPKGDLALDTLPTDFGANGAAWNGVLERLIDQTMPPEGKSQPNAADSKIVRDWITAGLNAYQQERSQTQGRTGLRRLNRVEYENTVRDLLGVDIDLKEPLPVEASGSGGFDNDAEALHVSSFLMEKELQAAERALDAAIANGPKPQTINKRYIFNDESMIRNAGVAKGGNPNQDTRKQFRLLDDAVVIFPGTNNGFGRLGQFRSTDRGKYRFRVSAYGFQSPGKPVTFEAEAGVFAQGQMRHKVGYFDVSADKPPVVEFVVHLEAGGTINTHPCGIGRLRSLGGQNGADNYKGAGLALQWVEVEGPLYDSWPPPSHRRLFGDLPQAPVAGNRLEVVSKRPLPDAERILRDFARRAFRRPVTDDDVKPFVGLVKDKLAENWSFEQAVRAGLQAVLVSPNFLFLGENPGKLDDFALASRLSYFLWSSMPDEELLALAGKGKLVQPETLRQQVERMLEDPKAAAFTENFLGQWLGLRDIDFTQPDPRLYQDYDPQLKDAMVKEAQLFFTEVLKDDLSLTNFVASDFTMLNERLALHYGIPGVDGSGFRKTTLPPGSHRGGFLTMAAVLKVTANGTTTSPVIRGAWVLDRILGTPPPPPPPDVEPLVPDIRGATTIRQQLAKHRNVPACASCHAKIDPAGFALESFDVIGGWRENYRVVGRGKGNNGPKVDPADVLPDGRRFRNIDELKQLLLKDKEQIARPLAVKLLTYATGRRAETADGPEIEAIVRKLRDKNYGLRTLVHEIVECKTFQYK